MMEINKNTGFNSFDEIDIQCPYCFKKFKHYNVGFRATPIAEETKRKWQNLYKEKISSDDAEGQKFYQKKLELAEKFGERKDEVFLDYWRNRGWEASLDQLYEVGDGYTEFGGSDSARKVSSIQDPVIGISGDDLIGDKIVDEFGFVTEAIDIRGEDEGKTSKRVCPYCHNILPNNYGRNPIKFIAVVGVSGVGKTVMLSKLLELSEELLRNVEYSVTYVNNYTADSYVKKYKIEQDREMPMGTNKTQFKPPIFLDVEKNNKLTTFVLYDIAGENCVDAEKIDIIGPFIRNADGIIMLLDPEQISSFDLSERTNNGNITALKPNAVINAMKSAFLHNTNQKSQIPIAVTFSKSDLFRIAKVAGENVVRDNSNIFKTLSYKNNAFMIDEFCNVDGEVRQIVHKYCKELIISMQNTFETYGFFAISTLGHDTEKEGDNKYYLRMNIEQMRLEEPLMWLMYRWNMINSYTEREKKPAFFKLFGGRKS